MDINEISFDKLYSYKLLMYPDILIVTSKLKFKEINNYFDEYMKLKLYLDTNFEIFLRDEGVEAIIGQFQNFKDEVLTI